MDKNSTVFGFIGTGNMGGALAQAARHTIEGSRILLANRSPEKALALAGDLLVVKELHRKLWFDTNRGSEWELCALRYDDLYDRLRMFARNCRNRKMFNIHV